MLVFVHMDQSFINTHQRKALPLLLSLAYENDRFAQSPWPSCSWIPLQVTSVSEHTFIGVSLSEIFPASLEIEKKKLEVH